MAVSPNPVFKFSGQMYTVKVENVPSTVTRREIVKLFTALIGDVRRCDEYFDDTKRRVFQLEFNTSDTAKKALCMTGYTVSGHSITVSASVTGEPCRQPREAKHGDGRRNLYVLGLPFDLTKSEFVEMFSRHGSVSHAVILATVDNASRRRGFVVMSNHREARIAMDALSRKEIKGHTIDVSWAVVQRSQGFLDGGDRTMVLSQQTPMPSTPGPVLEAGPAELTYSTEVIRHATPIAENAMQQEPSIPTSVAGLIITNLPSVLFSQVADLHPLLYPFGEITDLKILSEKPEDGTIVVFVEYKTLSQAREARESLRGQQYTSQPVRAEFFQPAPVVSQIPSDSDFWPTYNADTKMALNPLAAPFLAEYRYTPDYLAEHPREYWGNLHGLDKASNASTFASRKSSPFFEAPGYRSNVNSALGMFDPQVATHRPHSAPSEYVS
ncbi:hypothetical protein BDW22DRAFT_1352461 [Trametopsis cervina]|nr:hypothetical protein BDW22DRAFT_1352461 [Trametopsis cervina]